MIPLNRFQYFFQRLIHGHGNEIQPKKTMASISENQTFGSNNLTAN
jgi:hypothetical protein